jgi:hypothetical protein
MAPVPCSQRTVPLPLPVSVKNFASGAPSRGTTLTPLTASMARLRDEILVLRQERDSLRAELRRGNGVRHAEVQAWRSAFLEDLVGIRRVWAAPGHERAPVPPPLATSAPPLATEPAAHPPKAAGPELLCTLVKPPPPVPPEEHRTFTESPSRTLREPVHPPAADLPWRSSLGEWAQKRLAKLSQGTHLEAEQ